MSCTIIDKLVSSHKQTKVLVSKLSSNPDLLQRMATQCFTVTNDKLVFTDKFKTWCDDRGDKLDGRTSATKIANLVIEFYNTTTPSAISETRDCVAQNNPITKFGYSSAKARIDSKNAAISFVLNQYEQNEYNSTVNPREYEVAKFIMYKLAAANTIDGSDLTRADKLNIKTRIYKECKTKDDIVKILSTYKLDTKINIKSGKRAYYLQLVRHFLRTSIKDRLVKRGINEDVARNLVLTAEKTKDFTDVSKALQIKVDDDYTLSLPDQNIIAIYQEWSDNPSALEKELFRNSKLKGIGVKSDDFHDEGDKEAVDAQSDLDEENNPENEYPDNDDFDSTIAMYDHSGTFTKVGIHVGEKVKTVLGSIYKCNSTNKLMSDNDSSENSSPSTKYDLYLNPNIGEPETIDINQCITALYHRCRIENVDSFVESIKDIAQDIPGLEGLIQLYDKLIADSDLAYLFYTTFGKLITYKTQNVISEGVVTTTITNVSGNKRNALSIEYMSSLKNSTLYLNKDFAVEKLNNISSLLRGFSQSYDTYVKTKSLVSDVSNTDLYKTELNDYKTAIYELLHDFLPTITESVVDRYIDRHNTKADDYAVVANCNTLFNIAKSFVDEMSKIQRNYTHNQNELHNLRVTKYRQESATSSKFDPYALPTTNSKPKIEEPTVTDEMIEEATVYDFLTDSVKKAAMTLAEQLVSYSVVSVDNNSVNVEGNQSSDVINMSFIMRMKQIIENPELLQAYGKDKLKSLQYKYSNIFLEEKVDGKIVKYGLFSKDNNGDYIPTEYAAELLGIELYDGAKNYDTGVAATYKKFSKTDYIASAFTSFFTVENKHRIGKLKDGDLARYFMRVPSDAPKNFIIQSIKYNTSGLFKDKKVNRDHKIFKLFKDTFKQELLDCARGVNFLFSTTRDGKIERLDDIPVLRDGHSNDGRKIAGAYANYHFGKGGKIIEEIHDGLETKYRLVGNVFHSDRFICWDSSANNGKGDSINFGEQILENENFYLFGGDESRSYLHTIKDLSGDVVDIRLTRIQESVIDDAIEQYITLLCKDTVERMMDFKSSIDREMDDANYKRRCMEFGINYAIMYNNFNALFEGDTKFYKSPQDFLKRAKEVQGSGIPYALTKLGDYDNDKKLVQKSKLNGTIFGTKNTKQVVQYNKFTGLTIVNTVQHREETLDIIKQKLLTTGSNVNIVNSILYGPNEAQDGGYRNATVNDAQSYITMDEWIRRVYAKGQGYKYKALIDKIVNNEPLNANDLESFVQVQKNFYYDQYYDNDSKIDAPRQIKNAEFVLIPEFIKGTELEIVAKIMDKYGIDQLNTEETSKAGKTNVLTIFDAKEGTVLPSIINDVENNTENSEFAKQVKGATYLYDYNYLYTQQETPQHANAENKAGIQIVKKMVDNISPTSELYPVKQKFFKLYCSNIKDSFMSLARELNFPLNEFGNLDIKTNEDGSYYLDIKYDLFYSRLEDEMSRLGLNSNMLDYVTRDAIAPTEDGYTTLMPNYMSLVSQKLENISQAIFNSSITRQTLPGFHAAQISNVGFRKLASKENITTDISYGKKLRYHTKINEETGEEEYAPYIEVLVSKSYFSFKRKNNENKNKSDEELLAELQAEGLDEFIGYRIPTEGKQSVAVMKVVGFVDDGYGSTIIVPNEWVPQTGSDFDIDSIYGIQHNTYIDRVTGQIKKVKYKNEVDRKDWYKYIDNKTSSKLKEIGDAIFNSEIAKAVADTKQEAKAKTNAFYAYLKQRINDLLKQEREAWRNLGHDLGKLLVDFHATLPKSTNRAQYIQNLIDEHNYIVELAKTQTLSNEQLNSLNVYLDVLDTLANDLNRLDNSFDAKDIYKTIKKENVSNAISEVDEKIHEYYSNLAIVNNLKSFEVFKQEQDALLNNFSAGTEDFVNTREARTNELVDCMLTIMTDDESLEECFSRSNSDDIKQSRDWFLEGSVFQHKKETRSCYNFLDQADYQEEVMSGAVLKGYSVARDSFASVCNTVMPTVNLGMRVSVVYDLKDMNIDELVKRYGKEHVLVDRTAQKVKVRFNKYGWSNDNRNVIGKLITPYSSQTTAYILDAVKEGNIPNVNTFTFKVYKTLPDLGIDYDTILAFIMQPAISQIIAKAQKSESVYYKEYTRPIEDTIKELRNLAVEYKLIRKSSDEEIENGNKYYTLDNYNDVLEELSEYCGEITAFDILNASLGSLDVVLEDIPLDKQLFKARFDGKFSETTNAVIDLYVALQYRRIEKLSDEIGRLVQVCNPDKFGAKQTLFSTNKVLNDIQDIAHSKNRCLTVYKQIGDSVVPVSFVEAIYPGISEQSITEFMSSQDNNSSYPPMLYFLKYATATSLFVNRSIFKTESVGFRSMINGLSDYLSDNSKLTEKEYKNFQKYVINEAIVSQPAIKQPLEWDRENETFRLKALSPNTAEEELEEERNRIFGFGYPIYPVINVESVIDETVDGKTQSKTIVTPVEFTADIINPTDQDIENYIKLSPGQKIMFIKKNFKDLGIFDSISDVNYLNSKSIQSLRFVEDNVDIEDIFDGMFIALNQKNPFISLAVYDLIKYAFVVEGYNFTKKCISKMLSNKMLYKDRLDGGIDLISGINHTIDNILTVFLDENNIDDRESLYERYIRSAGNDIKIPSRSVKWVDTKSGKKKAELTMTSGTKMYIIDKPKLSDGSIDKNNEDFIRLLQSYHIAYVDHDGLLINNTYVKLAYSKSKPTILYKIEERDNAYYLYPLNPLSKNEHTDISINGDNQQYYPKEFFIARINELESKKNGVDPENPVNISDYEIKRKKPIKSLYPNIANMNSEAMHDFKRIIRDHVTKEYNKNNGFNTPIVIRGSKRNIGTVLSFPTTHLEEPVLEYTFPVEGKNITVRVDRVNKKLIGKTLNKYLNMKNEPKAFGSYEIYKDVINAYRAAAITEIPSDEILVKISPIEKPRITLSAIDETQIITSDIATRSAYNAINRREYSDPTDTTVDEIRNFWYNKNINSNNIESNKVDIITPTATYIDAKVQDIRYKLNHFVLDENGVWLSMADPKIIPLMLKDKHLEEEFLKIINDAQYLVTNFKIFTELDIDSQDISVKNNIRSIRDNIIELDNNSALTQARINFADNYLKEFSKNPMLKNDMAHVLNHFYSTNTLNALFNDLSESSNTLVQIITKRVLNNLAAYDALSKRKIEDFDKTIADIKTRARKAGTVTDLSRIIKDGKMIKSYSDEFETEYNALKAKVDQAKDTYGEYSIEHLRTRLEFRKFKRDHCEQPLVIEYYNDVIALEDFMLNGVIDSSNKMFDDRMFLPTGFKNYALGYSEYKKLELAIISLRKENIDGTISPDNLKKLNDLIDKQNRLLSETQYFTPEPKPMYMGTPIQGDRSDEQYADVILGSKNTADALNFYKEHIQEINETYFEYKSAFNFEDELKKNLKIINDYEKPNAFGKPTVPMSELRQNKEYTDAVEWVNKYAKFDLGLGDKRIIRLAFKTFSKNKTGDEYKKIIENAKALDENRIVDGRRLTEKDRQKIKELDEHRYNITHSNAGSDRTLIKVGSPVTDVFTKDFYDSMSSKGVDNPAWYKIVSKINNILSTIYDEENQVINWSLIPDNEEGKNTLKTLISLYNDLENTRKTVKPKKKYSSKQFRDKFVNFNINQAEFDRQEGLISQKSKSWQVLWRRINEFVTDEGTKEPNARIYGYLTPVDSVYDQYVDKDKSRAIKVLETYFEKVPTEYYEQASFEAYQKGETYYKKWYADNHIYNPYTRKMEPISCWTKSQLKRDKRDASMWVPKGGKQIKTIIKPNPNYKSEANSIDNYKLGTDYDNPELQGLNEYDLELKDYISNLLRTLCTTNASKRFIEKGFIPARYKNNDSLGKTILKEVGATLGVIPTDSGEESFYDTPDYAHDISSVLPMTTLLAQKTLDQAGIVMPDRKDYPDDDTYNDAINKYHEDIKAFNEENANNHKSSLDTNYQDVLREFIQKAIHYNAVQKNKMLLFYGRDMLAKSTHYKKKYGIYGDLAVDKQNSDNTVTQYKLKHNDQLLQTYDTFVRRIVYDQWKEKNSKFTKVASVFQNLTSAQYMMMNIRGGIANVTLGETQIWAENFARQYFETKDWMQAGLLWSGGVISYFADIRSDKASSLQSAIIKFFNVVDYDEVTGRSRITENPVSAVGNGIRNILYSPQSMGEFYMQNRALFAMLMSHKIIEIKDVNGNTKLEFVNKNEFIRGVQEEALLSVLTDDQKFDYKTRFDEVKRDANKLKKYMWFRNDFATDYARHRLNKEQQKLFLAKRDELMKKREEEFDDNNTFPSIIDQLELVDGNLTFKQDSLLAKYNVTDETGLGSSYKLLADIRGRVISVNKKIHGVYDRIGQARIEEKWYGSLVMQYHKHIPTGINKRYRKEGYYNEQRGSIEKGAYVALWDFLATPFRDAKYKKELSEDEISTLESIKMIAKEVVDFTINHRFNYHLLNPEEKANMRRRFGDLAGIISAIFLAVALKAMDDDDEYEDSILYNLALYEVDRLASESFQFNPIGGGFGNEFKKLWSTPIAAQSGVEDLIQSIGLLVKLIQEGEDFDPYYHSGRFAGEHKLKVYIERRIPVYRGIKTAFVDIIDTNNYYKLGENMLGSHFVELFTNWIIGDKD